MMAWSGNCIPSSYMEMITYLCPNPDASLANLSLLKRPQKAFLIFQLYIIRFLGELVQYHRCSLQWRHNGRNGVSNNKPYDCLLNRLFRGRSKKTSKLRVTGLCTRNSPVTDEFPAQMASNTENVCIWWCHHVISSSFSAPDNQEPLY